MAWGIGVAWFIITRLWTTSESVSLIITILLLGVVPVLFGLLLLFRKRIFSRKYKALSPSRKTRREVR